MIIVNDLRVGNLFKYYIGEDGIDWQETKIDAQDIIWCESKNENFNQVHKPIEITVDILKRLHFKRQKTDKEYFDWIYTKSYTDGYICVLCEALGRIVITLPEGGWMVHIQYIHQLQNLFYCLSGIELDMSGLK